MQFSRTVIAILVLITSSEFFDQCHCNENKFPIFSDHNDGSQRTDGGFPIIMNPVRKKAETQSNPNPPKSLEENQDPMEVEPRLTGLEDKETPPPHIHPEPTEPKVEYALPRPDKENSDEYDEMNPREDIEDDPSNKLLPDLFKPNNETMFERSENSLNRRALVTKEENNRPNPWNTKPGLQFNREYDFSPLYSRNASNDFDYNTIIANYNNKRDMNKCVNPVNRINFEALKQAFSIASSAVGNDITKALNDFKADNVVKNKVISAEGRHRITGRLPSELKDFVAQEDAFLMEYAARALKNNLKFCINPVEMTDYLPKIPLNGIQARYLACKRIHGNLGGSGLPCRDSKFRTFDGSCNNLLNAFWGKANVCHVRFLPPAYDDAISSPRTLSVTGTLLPAPRDVSINLHGPAEGSTYYTLWHFVWGQYIVHDMVSTPQAVPAHGEGINCCTTDDPMLCLPIKLKPTDPQYGIRNCINFVRSAPCPLCSLGPRQQINMATSFLDQSAMYGSDVNKSMSLRIKKRGLMEYGKDIYNNPILPNSDAPKEDQCSKPGPTHTCFRAGDQRVNQQPQIQLIHTLFLRRHNQHAFELSRVLQGASDELIFQEARRLTIAELQHITYYEYLPILLGPELTAHYQIIEKNSLFSKYNPETDPTTWNECAAAACRFGHSQIKSFVNLVASKRPNGFNLRDNFFDPTLIHEGHAMSMIKGLLEDQSAVVDPYLTDTLKNFVYFHKGKDKFGGDLAAFNIQRGRDHGLPPYTAMLDFCFGYKVSKWEDLAKFMPPDYIHKLAQVYRDPRDIDLFTGGLYEKKAIDADLGPTFACIVGIQFHALKFGDRYFYSHYGQTGSFTPDQLRDMKSKFSLTNFLCQTENNLDVAQTYGFLIPDLRTNPFVDCRTIRQQKQLNYNLWRGLR